MPSRRDFLMAGGALAVAGPAARAQSGPLKVTGARPTIFYAPLIATVTQGFLKKHGVDADFHWLGTTPLAEGLKNGSVDVIQSAVSSFWTLSDRDETTIPVHIAEINRRDGFFLLRRGAIQTGDGPAFDWRQLEGKTIVAELGGQPAHMLRYALSYNKVDPSKVRLVDGGTGPALRAAFRSGAGDFAHFQGAVAQQVELDGEGAIVTSVGASMPEVSFSTVCALPQFVQHPAYRPFLAAFAQAKAWAHSAPARVVAENVAPQFSDTSLDAMIKAVQAYQRLGCWAGPLGVSRAHYDQALAVFRAAGAVKGDYAFEQACISPP
ncbi:MAG TPA: ABC transporter substrate-binding protein [Rhizomicrobium sp.]|nr:ABC transporter substrate-binding protein [Rhizomicrobium sp.]